MKFSKSSVRTGLIALAAAGGLAAWSAPGLAENGAATGMGPGMMSGAGVRPPAQEQPAAGGYGPGYGMGAGMMGGYGGSNGMGPGMMGGYGMGPGMMGGWGMGPGMMGGWGGGDGMGPGMMGGCGMGPGMMGGWGGYGMGPGMMYGYGSAGAILDLSDEQASGIEKIYAGAQQKQWDLASKTFAASAKLRELLASEAPDRKAVGSAYKALSDLHLQQLESRLDTRAKVDAVLTKEQRERLQNWRRGAFAPWY